MNRNTGAVVATLVAGMFVTQGCKPDETSKTPEAKSTTSKVRCMGVNECSGKGACSSATNGCSGKNSCKGKGWMEVESEKVCLDKGGTIVRGEPSMKMDEKGS